ncbi:MAG TPA: fluoride efflux transporter CrcB [bacterium]|nr:fluoride efflux transporter CrcB [bacterium]
MTRFLYICLGGALGTGVRYLVSGWTLRAMGPSFPFGTLGVNVLGSFLIGAIMHIAMSTSLLSPTARIFLTTGVMGGFTTYSSFNYETVQYFQDGEIFRAFLNILVMVVSCLAAGFAGLFLAKRLLVS